MKRTRVLAATCALTMALAIPATAGEVPDFEPELVESTEWFSCDSGETPEWTVNTLVDGVVPTWKPVAPTGSVTGAEGCASANPSVIRGVRPETPFDLSFRGTYRGNLDELTVSMHNILVGTGQTGAPVTLNMRMTINGQSLFGTQPVSNAAGDVFEEPAVRAITVMPQATGSTGVARLLEFTVTDIGLLTEADKTKRHQIVMTFETAFTNASRQNVWAWGNTEAPSSLTFNAEERAAVVTERAS